MHKKNLNLHILHKFFLYNKVNGLVYRDLITYKGYLELRD